MTAVQSYQRFSDEKYKNWLKTAESLSILRLRMEDFIEKETETYHSSLGNKAALKGKKCTNDCDLKKKKNLCKLCNDWKKEISDNHANNKAIVWDNCRPHLWSAKKWEVAKAYMSRGHREHSTFAEFDISAIFNFINFCKHFKNKDIPKQCLLQVINVRNSVMHSPDFKMGNADMEKHLAKVLELAKKLEPRVPKLKNLDEEIKQFNNILDKNFNQDQQCEVDGKLEDMKEKQIVLDREQQAMKEKLEDFILLFQGTDESDGSDKEQLKDLIAFLNQNKDLKVNFGTQFNKLKEMEEKVNQHDQKIDNLEERVDHLEQKKPDPVFVDTPLKYKNHLYELARKNHWPEPKFTEEREANGYKAKVEVNGQTFYGTKVWNSTKNAHQEVAGIALQKLEAENTDEPSTSALMPSSKTFFGKVTVVLDRDVASGGCYSSKEEAIESAYEDLWKHLQDVMGPVQGQTYKSAILEYFNRHGFQNPAEEFVQKEDNTTICKLKLSGPLTFNDTVGSTKKKQAEQQAAKVALKHLSKILSCGPVSENENFKSALKESLEKLSLGAAVYDTESTDVPRGTSPEPSIPCVIQTSVKRHSDPQCESIPTSSHLPSGQSHVSVSGSASVSLEPQDSSSPAFQRKKARIDSSDNRSGIPYFGKVTVNLDQEFVSEGCCSNKEEASESAYQVLWHHLHIDALSKGQTYKSAILEYFNTHGFQNPAEELVQKENNTTICKLRLSGPFTFHDTVGSIKKKQAEQQAAKVALKHLSKILSCGPVSENENFKSILKEVLEKRSLGAAVYDTESTDVPRGTSPEPSISCVTQTSVKEPSDLMIESIPTSSHLPSHQSHVSVSGSASVSLEPQDSSSPAFQRKKARIDDLEIDTLLSVCNLKPPCVNVENIDYDENFKCTVEINFENFTFTNKQVYDSKKEAIRKTYLLFGLAVGILDSTTDDKMSSAQVKQHFSQKSLPLPQEDVEGSAKSFCCSLKNINYSVIYKEQGPSENEAKLLTFQKALSSLSQLFDYPIPGANSPEEAENQLSSMLKGADQKDAVISLHGPLVKTSVQLNFTDHTIKCTCKGNKKAARNHLSLRILGLMGVKTDTDKLSSRNRLDEWFKQQNLQQPVFEDTEEAVGAKATFSVQFTCCSSDWEENRETAKKKLVEELKQRFQFLND